MSDTKIYDQLVAEFEEAGKYHGLGFVPPEMVALSAYDDTTLIPVVKDDEGVQKPTETVVEVPEVDEEPTETIVEVPEVDEEPKPFDARVEAPKAMDALDRLVERVSEVVNGKKPENEKDVEMPIDDTVVPEDVKNVEPEAHVFPIKRMKHNIEMPKMFGNFNFFGKAA